MQDLYGETWTAIDYVGSGFILLVVAALFFTWGYCRGVDATVISNSETRERISRLQNDIDSLTGHTPPNWARSLVSENNSLYQHTFKMGPWKEKIESVAPIPKMSDYHNPEWWSQKWAMEQAEMRGPGNPYYPGKHSKVEPIVTQTAGAPHQPTVDYIVNKLIDPILRQDQV